MVAIQEARGISQAEEPDFGTLKPSQPLDDTSGTIILNRSLKVE
jgi:hypothetical protein